MGEVYNPESELREKLEALELEARDLAAKRERAHDDDERRVIDRQLGEINDRIASLKRRFKPQSK